MRTLLALLFVAGCSPSVQLVEDTVWTPPIRVDTVYVRDYGEFYAPAECDTAAILAALCRGVSEGESEGLHWKFEYQKVAGRLQVQGVVLTRLKDSVRVLLGRPSVEVRIPAELREQIARLQSNQERHGWWDWLAAGMVGAVVVIALGVALWFMGRLKL